MTCSYSEPLPLHKIDEIVGSIRAHASLARIEADSAHDVAEQMLAKHAVESLTCASVAEIERAVAIARTKRERAAWLAGLLAEVERDAERIREMSAIETR